MFGSVLFGLAVTVSQGVLAYELAPRSSDIDVGRASAGGGAQVVGDAHSTGALATPQGVVNAANTVISEVSSAIGQATTQLGQGVEGALRQGAAEQAKEFDALQQTMHDLFVQFGAAQRRAKVEDDYGPESLPEDACNYPTLMRALARRKKSGAEHVETLRRAVDEWDGKGDRYSATLRDIGAISDDALDPRTILAPSTPEEAELGAEMVSVLLNPLPEPEIPEDLKETPGGKRYIAAKKIKKARLGIPRMTVFRAMEDGAPVSGDLAAWIREKWEQSGLPGDPPGISSDGKASLNAYIDASVDMRFTNPEWFLDVMRMNDRGLSREMVMMMALSLKMQQMTLFYQKMTALLLAQMESGNVSKDSQRDFAAARSAIVSGSDIEEKN